MKAHELITGPKKWVRGAAALDGHGVSVLATDPSACCWCLYGALRKCYGPTEWQVIYNRIAACLGVSPVKWQDDPLRTFREVKDLLVRMDV